MDLSVLLVPLLATLTVGGLCYALLEPMISGDSQAEKRRAALQSRVPSQAVGRGNDVARRRKQVTDSLKEIDARTRSKKLSFEAKMGQAGLSWTKSQFAIGSAISGVVAGFLGYVFNGNPMIAAGIAIIGGFGLPRWYVGHRRNSRVKKFLNAFPAAIDIIVRGIKAGIPLGDCLRNISTEADEPVRTEFRQIIEAQTMGLSVPEAVERIVERVPAAEAAFFSIVINIQAKAGGNLAEALANLSNVLRDRKKMKGKIKAMSAEAKSSAAIIGALPFLVAGAVYMTNPAYISLLFSTSTGNMVLGVCAFWMSLGIFIMRKMINFDM